MRLTAPVLVVSIISAPARIRAMILGRVRQFYYVVLSLYIVGAVLLAALSAISGL